MQRILIGMGMVVFVGALAAGATGAFFSDTETSTGNVFTAGAIDLKVDSTQHYNNAICTATGTSTVGTWQLAPNAVVAVDQYPVIGSACDGTWTLTDLGPTFKFFNFGDIKPADQGEDTVSLHIDNNPAYACVDLLTTGNNENGINGPEAAAGDITPAIGELAPEVHFIAWLDTASTSGAVAGDNIWQANEPLLAGPSALSALNGTTTLTLADGGLNGGTPLPGGVTDYIGLAWCAGTIVINSPGNFTCDGSTMGNEAQTDSATTTVAFRVIQARNNSAFRCVAPAPLPAPVN